MFPLVKSIWSIRVLMDSLAQITSNWWIIEPRGDVAMLCIFFQGMGKLNSCLNYNAWLCSFDFFFLFFGSRFLFVIVISTPHHNKPFSVLSRNGIFWSLPWETRYLPISVQRRCTQHRKLTVTWSMALVIELGFTQQEIKINLEDGWKFEKLKKLCMIHCAFLRAF